MCNTCTLIEAAIYFQVIPTYQPTSVVGKYFLSLFSLQAWLFNMQLVLLWEKCILDIKVSFCHLTAAEH